MLSFKPIAIEDKDLVCQYTCIEHYGTTESAFLDLFIWGKKYNTQVAFEDGFMFIRTGCGKESAYLFPYGKGDLKEAVLKLVSDAKQQGAEFCMVGVTERMKEKLCEIMPDTFVFEENRDVFDYVYSAQSLIELPGKKLHPKRTNVNKFMATYGERYLFEEITEKNLEEVHEFQKRWLAENTTEDNRQGLQDEMDAIERAFRYYFKLGIEGAIIRVDGEIVAYSMGMPLCHSFYVVSVEKADTAYAGIYQVINKLFATHYCSEYKYINREEDTGAEGLRRAKLSYQPEFLITKYEVRFK